VYPSALAALTPVVLEPAFRAPYLTTAHWLRDFYAWPDDRRCEWQWRRLEAVVAQARRHVPFYRELLGPRRNWRGTSLADLPPVDKIRIAAKQEAFLADDLDRRPTVAKRTGGTTGDPWRYPLDRRAWTHMYAAGLHLFERTGYRYGERVVLLGAPASLGIAERDLRARLRRRIERHDTSLAGFAVDADTSARRVLAAVKAPAALWYGFAGTIAAMADAVLERGLSVRAPRAIVTTAEPLQPEWRRRIEQAFGIAPFDQYGCNDGGVLAQTCHRGRFHVAENLSIVEVLDGDRACAPGREGDVVVTNLHAVALPFLRYRTGDRAVLGEGRCPCGTPGQTFERVGGREVDRLSLAGGVELSGLSFGSVFMHTHSVRRWQVVQRDARHIVVRLDLARPLPASERSHVLAAMRARCGEAVEVELDLGAEIERTPGGKQRLVVRVQEDSAGRQTDS
jgi:phenylacetate-CoA ligase